MFETSALENLFTWQNYVINSAVDKTKHTFSLLTDAAPVSVELTNPPSQ